MKNKEKKAQNEKILEAFKKVLLANKADLSNKIEKSIKKSIKKIVKKTFKKNSKVTKQKTETPTVNPPKIKSSKKLPK